MLKKIIDELIYIFLNYFVCNIPIWFIRKFFYKSLGMKIGKGSRILMKTIIVHPWKIVIGENTYINEKCFLDGRGKLNIGSNVSIAIYSKIITAYHDINDNDFIYREEPINISDNVVIFANSIILAGVQLQRGCVISADSLVNRGTYVERGIYAGNSAKYIGIRKTDANYVLDKWHPWFR